MATFDKSSNAFTDLALRVITGEASVDDRRAFEAEIAANPDRREEFAELQTTHRLLCVAVPMTEAAQATGPELPAYRLNELRTAVRQHFGPVANRAGKSFSPLLVLRWIFAGGAAAVIGTIMVMILFSNSTVEIGLYRTDLMRGDNAALTPENVPAAKIMAFDADAPFDQWQAQPLAWYQHAKIWVDNEHDLLHIVRRGPNGQITTLTQPLAESDEAQREQIQQAVQDLRN
jgi:anti-sigma factor RsiW